MVTQCPTCRRWFRITREQTEAAHGLARCGGCQAVFNALASLRDSPPDDSAEETTDRGAEEREVEAKADPDAELPVLLERSPRARRVTRGLWLAALVIATLALFVQLVHANRYAIANMPGAGTALRTIYRGIGMPLRARLVLARYAIAGASLGSIDNSSGELRLNGTLVNRAPFIQRLPLFELRLRDRHGDVIASRLLLPSDYAPTTINTLATGQRLRFRVEMADPGARATGFTLVLCMRRAGGVQCRAS